MNLTGRPIYQKEVPYKDEKILDEVRHRKCYVCGRGQWDMQHGRWSNESHHIKPKGMGGAFRDDRKTVSLCHQCHMNLHAGKIKLD